jgi:hypothetical protein
MLIVNWSMKMKILFIKTTKIRLAMITHLSKKIQDSNHQDNHDSIDKNSTLDKKDEDNPLHQAFTSLDTIIHQEALIKIIP